MLVSAHTTKTDTTKRGASMPKRIPPLTDLQVSKAKPKPDEYKLSDGGGLHLLVTPSGGKLWRLQYRFSGKQKTLAIGQYPAISLADARQRREDARKLLASSQDPAAIKKIQRATEEEQAAIAGATFEVVAREWFAKNEPIWSGGHATTVINRLNHDVFPDLGKKPVIEIKAADVRSILLKIGARGATETGQRVKIICGQIFRYAIGQGLIEHDPSVALRPSELFPRRETGHHAAITDPKELAPLLRAIDSYQGTTVVKAALRLLPILFVRPGELQKMKWSEVDFENSEWRYLVTKTRTQHIVPLPLQAMSILRELQSLAANSQYAFPGRTSTRPMSNMAMTAALDYIGYKNRQTPHGFRATARTILDEVLGFRPDFIEHQLAHSVRDPLGRAYNRTAHLAERRKMMQAWADYLDDLKNG